MRALLGPVMLCWAALLGLPSCESRRQPDRAVLESDPSTPPAQRSQPPLEPPPRAAPSAALAIERSLQEKSLRLAPTSGHVPRLVLGKGVVGQLTDDSVRVYSTRDASLLSTAPLEAPRAVLTLADGALLAIGARAMLRLEPGHKPISLPKPMLLPGAEVFADAVQADRIWIFEGQRTPPRLAGYRLAPGPQLVVLPEQEIELESPSGGAVGTTREGVWLYFTPGRVERLGPGGARLKSFTAPELLGQFLLLPTRRLDQQYFLNEAGQLTRALVTPLFRKLSQRELGLTPFAAATVDEGRLLAVIAVAGEGPRFELSLFDEALALRGQALLPTEPPTGREDWVQVVTRNLQLAGAAREPLVAVGGPERVQIFDDQCKTVLSIPSR